jgi:hypothetical protein
MENKTQAVEELKTGDELLILAAEAVITAEAAARLTSEMISEENPTSSANSKENPGQFLPVRVAV